MASNKMLPEAPVDQDLVLEEDVEVDITQYYFVFLFDLGNSTDSNLFYFLFQTQILSYF